ncbi:hypothetical protein PROAA_3060004 [Candidatus Propionivibrio aalborgensis]|uniref:Uncharacterized protein n=1 Tax=Candidatus Propionivibrio aalborgensis TaxID=1860101 RepID=A0A1A8XVT0_9RHOO|nr:hypothetical protein [Candidatus Propionivibrio aalborgensis]SBT09124.1 hypothetical protein PROAA_3060004 [Candidatus Propionivibrio aalborgensis]
MSGTLTVKELIKELLEYEMHEPVFISLGSSGIRPQGSAKLSHTNQHDSNITCGFGVYLHTAETLADIDA